MTEHTDTAPTPLPTPLDVIQVGPVMQTRSQVHLQAALAKAQGTIKPVEEDGFDSFKKSRYSSESAVRRSINEAFSRLGLSILQWWTLAPHVSKDMLQRVQVTTRVCHASGEWCQTTSDIPVERTKGNTLAQDIGRAVTYGCRYSLGRVAGTYTGDPIADSTVENPPEDVQIKKSREEWRNGSPGQARATEERWRQEKAETSRQRTEWLNNLLASHDLDRAALDAFLHAQEWGARIQKWPRHWLQFLSVLIPAMRTAEFDFPEVSIWLGGATPLGRMNDAHLADVARAIRADGWAQEVREVNRQALGQPPAAR